jgi:hypothetical protein
MPKRAKAEPVHGCAECLQQLPTLDKAHLWRLWLELFGQPATPRLRRELMVPILAYRLQEKELGELPVRQRNRLRALTMEDRGIALTRIVTVPQIKRGTQLIREWQGETHRVVAAAQGFEYGEKTYSSLSQIARLITGTRWSGPLFFGLRQAPTGRTGS